MTLVTGDPRHKATIARIRKHIEQRYPHSFSSITASDNSPITTRSLSRKDLTPVTGTLSDAQLKHLLYRTRFGISPSDWNAFQGRTIDYILDTLLSAPELKIPVNNYYKEQEDPEVRPGETFIHAKEVNADVESARIISLKAWMVDHIYDTEGSIYPTMWFFWQSILVVQMWESFYAYGSYRYLKMLHDNALGNYKDMVYQATVDPTMLLYLNGNRNRKNAPDENYARELQELFTIGKGKDAAFTEGDVQEAARVLTGWRIPDYGKEVVFVAKRHDTEDKTFSSFYGNKTIKGRSGSDGAEETRELIDMIFSHTETSKYICRRLYTYFVYHHIDDWTEENIIIPLAQIFHESGYEITPVIRTLLASEHFHDTIHHGSMIKSPVDFLIGLFRGIGVTRHGDDATHDFDFKRSMLWTMANIGVQLGDPPGVAGWPAYYQVPNFDKNWITTSTIVDRSQITDALVQWGFWTESEKIEWNLLAAVESIENAHDPNALIDYLCNNLLSVSIDDEAKTSLKSVLLSGQDSDHYWSEAWDMYMNDKSNENKRNTVYYRLTRCLRNFFQYPEYHIK